MRRQQRFSGHEGHLASTAAPSPFSQWCAEKRPLFLDARCRDFIRKNHDAVPKLQGYPALGRDQRRPHSRLQVLVCMPFGREGSSRERPRPGGAWLMMMLLQWIDPKGVVLLRQ